MILDDRGFPIAPPVSEDLSVPPVWATDPDADVPCAYWQVNDAVDKFVLGVPPRAAVVLIDRTGWRAEPECLVGLAAGAWKAVVGEDCDRDMAELIAKAWIRAVELSRH